MEGNFLGYYLSVYFVEYRVESSPEEKETFFYVYVIQAWIRDDF